MLLLWFLWFQVFVFVLPFSPIDLKQLFVWLSYNLNMKKCDKLYIILQ